MQDLIIRHRKIISALCHAILIGLALAFAFLMRFDFSIPTREAEVLRSALLLALAVKLTVFGIARMNDSWWAFIGIHDLGRLILANLSASLLLSAAVFVLQWSAFPRSVLLIDFILTLLLTAGVRFAVRFQNEALVHHLRTKTNRHALIYGAGAAGVKLAREMRTNPTVGHSAVGFLDDDPRKLHARITGLRVYGSGRDAPMVTQLLRSRGKKVDDIIIAMPSATNQQLREAIANCRAAGVGCKMIPGVNEILSREELKNGLKDVSLDDLLGRETVRLDESKINTTIRGRSVLVTGAAGSIGSELCEQIARFRPSQLVMLDQAESDLFRHDLALRERYPDLLLIPAIADVRNIETVRSIMRRHSIDVVYHAAAYKHVPLMETHLLEAVRNNVLGTWNVVSAAYECHVRQFVMISSDKAVNPSSIMGLTKRVAELLVSSFPTRSGTPGEGFVSVRFGNVLGSNGSVVPLFQAQVAKGGPVTVTHPDIERYFMTIPEAVQLVLQASTMGRGGEVFVLDMGRPVRILDLARNVIRLLGYKPDEEIEIRFTGLRPGEKLYEELITEGEHIVPTQHERVKVFRGPGLKSDEAKSFLNALDLALRERDETLTMNLLLELVPEYKRPRRTDRPAKQIAATAGIAS
jgi:FlaA1/EpsC-like NDP-sugar epimerase